MPLFLAPCLVGTDGREMAGFHRQFCTNLLPISVDVTEFMPAGWNQMSVSAYDFGINHHQGGIRLHGG
ncbi:MAG TPA: hypothetical protein DD465_21440 [Thalassospira sp.]|nr:hypothetical protein [Thalassospira sp.]